MAIPEKNCQPTLKRVICISGLAGTGKSTLAKKLAQKYKLKYFSGGDALKDLAKQQGYDISSQGWWESSVGINFLRDRASDAKFDKVVDDKMLAYAEQGDVLLDSWTMPWLLKGGFKIWLEASFDRRAARVAERDKMTLDEAIKMLQEKETRTKAIYKQLYGFVLGEDMAPFDFILDTDNLKADEVFSVLCKIIDNIIVSASSV